MAAFLTGLLGSQGGLQNILKKASERIGTGIKEKKKFKDILFGVGKGALGDVGRSFIPQIEEASKLLKPFSKIASKLFPTLADKIKPLKLKETLVDKIQSFGNTKVAPKLIEKEILEEPKSIQELVLEGPKPVKLKVKRKKKIKKIKIKKKKKAKGGKRTTAQKTADKKRMAALRARIGKTKKFKLEL